MKITLRELVTSDFDTVFAYQRHQESNLLAGVAARSAEEFRLHWDTNIIGGANTCNRMILADEKPVGYCVSWIHTDGRRLVGYWIQKSHWGKGIASKAFAAFLLEIKERPVFAFVATHNLASIRVLEKAGFSVLSTGRFFSKAHGHEIDDRTYVLQHT